MPKEKVHELEAIKIHTPGNRHRQLFNPKEMSKLVGSIKNLGQIQPGVCHTNTEGNIEILVGERRLRACEELGIKFKYILKEDITDPYVLERIQLEENLIRSDLDWKEQAFAIARIQQLLAKTERFKNLAETADYLGIGKSILHEDIQLSVWINEVAEVAAAPNKTVAKKIIKRLTMSVRQDEALEKSFEEIKAKKIKLPPRLVTTDDGEKIFIEEAPMEPDLSFQEEKLIDYSNRCILGKMEDKLCVFPDESFELVFFDPPWGVNYDEGQKGAENQKKFADSKDKFLEKFPLYINLIYDKMSENSHLYVFFGIVHYEFVYSTLREAGFKTSGIPLMWHKEGARRTRNPEYEYARCYEPIAFARKGTKKLNGSPIPDIISTPQPTQKLKGIHPSAKHPEIYLKLLSKSGYPGDKVLDPMGGSGMMGVAAESLRGELNLDWLQIEIDEDYRNLQLFNLTKGYDYFAYPDAFDDYVEREQKTFSGKDFKDLEPGSEAWGVYWRAYPEKQDEMIKWREKQK